MSDRYLPLGDSIERAYVTAAQDWLRHNRRGMDDEVAMTSTLRRVDLDVQLRPGRRGLVVITFVGRRQVDDDVYPFEVQPTPFSALRAYRT